MRKIWNTMLKGLVAILPIGLTLYLVYWLAVTAGAPVLGMLKLLLPERPTGPGSACSPGLALLYVAGLAVNAFLVRRALRPRRRPVRAHPGGQDHLRRDPRLHALLPVVRAGSDLKRVVLVPFGPARRSAS